MRPALGSATRWHRPRITAKRLVGMAIALPLAYLVAIVAAVHLGFGPLHGSTPLKIRLFGPDRVALIGSTVPGSQPGGGYGTGGSNNGTSGTPPDKVVKNLDDFFDPQVLRVPVGTTVEFHNDGRNPHTVTADDNTYDSGILQNGQVFNHTYSAPGVYAFNCKLHGAAGGIGMAGIIVVGDAQLPDKTGGSVGPGLEPVPTTPGKTIHVPADQPTVQKGVDAASPGDLVLVAPGVYHEAVLVRTPYITIRGEDRNTTILDGDLTKNNGIHVVEADGVVVENMTARRYALNGFYWTSVNGYRGSYLTAYANGDYGIYAFDSVWGRFDHDYASGSPDSGFYIGQCYPCHAVITDSVSTHNALGYSGTNAGGDLILANSEWTNNLAGIAPNTLDSERMAPQHDITIEGNWVHDNAATDAPTKRLEYPSYGIGVVAAGGRDNLIQGNLVENNPTFGIAILPNLDDNLWLTQGNEVRDNTVRNSGRADLALGAISTKGDCFGDNTFGTSMPPAIEVYAGCGNRFAGGGEMGATFSLLAKFATALGGHWHGGDWTVEPQPPDQAQMPDALTAAPVLAVPEKAVPGPVTVRTMDQIEAAAAAGTQAGKPAKAPASAAKEVMILGIPLASGFTTVLGLYGYILPFVLYAAWVAISLWDLVRREEISDRRRYAWMAVTLLVPFLGPVIYLVAGGSSIKRGTRLFLVFGAMALYLLIAVATFLLEALG